MGQEEKTRSRSRKNWHYAQCRIGTREENSKRKFPRWKGRDGAILQRGKINSLLSNQWGTRVGGIPSERGAEENITTTEKKGGEKVSKKRKKTLGSYEKGGNMHVASS